MNELASTTALDSFRTAIEDIANQLSMASEKDFDVLIRTEVHDPAIEKLQLLCNFALHSAHKALEDVRTSEARLRAVVDNAVDSIIVSSETGIIESANPAVEGMFGYRPEELIGQNVSILASEPHRQNHDGYLRHYRETGASKIIGKGREVVAQRKDKTIFRVDLALNEVCEDGVRKFVGILRDISAYKATEAKLHRSNEELQGLLYILGQCPVTIVVTDTEGKIEYVNPKFTQSSGYTAEEVIGKHARIIKSGEHSEAFYADLWKTITAGKEWRGEFHNKKKNGELYWEVASISPVTNELGKITHFVAIKEDVTEKRILESQLTRAQKLESIGELASGIAHEINTPTQFAIHNTHFLRSAFSRIVPLLEKYRETIQAARAGGLDDELLDGAETFLKKAKVEFLIEEIPKAIDQAIEGLDRIAKIVGSMKEFSHPGSSEVMHTDINHLLENTIAVSKNEWKYVAEVETEFDPGLPAVPCFAGELNQVFLNIIINAAQAIAEGHGETEEISDAITIRTKARNDCIEIEIADTGSGIPESILEKIFDPFFTTKEVGKGTGQGLAIAHSVIVDKHHGTISCRSEVGKGTTFTISLPLESELAAVGDMK